MNDDMQWRISITQARLNMGSFVARGIPAPTQVNFPDFSVERTQGRGGTVRHGFINGEILWATLTPYQASRVKSLIDEARLTTTGRIYMTVNMADGSNVGKRWVDISGLPALGPLSPTQPIAGSAGYLHSNVVLKLNNITILTESPSF